MRWFGGVRRKAPAGTALQDPLPLNESPNDGSPTSMIAGRERVRGVPYALPADMEEINRLDFQHYMLRYAFQGNYAAPIGSPSSILDAGTGTGRWAIEMAHAFPNANVIGIDVKPPAVDQQASFGAGVDLRPPNYSFVPGNLLEGLSFADGSFDFVHMRLLFTAIPHDRWPFVVGELARITRPGGWIELVDSIGLINGGPNVDLLMNWIRQLAARRAVDLMDGSRIAQYVQDAGLRRVVSHRVDLPTGQHGQRLGSLVATDFLSVCKGFGGVAVSQGLVTQAQWDETVAQAEVDLNVPTYRCVTPFFIAYGQRS
jgi:ubiquinone/menaquinone biosynthesis C-methylase UbiE